MRKIIFIVMFSLMGSLLFAHNEVKLNVNSNEIISAEDDDAIYCKIVYPDGTIYECWFCFCPNPNSGDEPEDPDTGTE